MPSTPPPNYQRIVNTTIMEALARNAPPALTFTGADYTAGTLAFGNIAAETDSTLNCGYVSTGLIDDVEILRAALFIYEGDNSAFLLDGIALQNGQGWQILLGPVPGTILSGTGYAATITATAANDGVAKAGTITLYGGYLVTAADVGPVLGTVALTKTYVAP